MAPIKSAFHVLGLDDAHELDLKADLVDRIGAIVRERGLTQATAGEVMGLGQAEVSKMLGGHLDRFTVDRLIKALAALGERVRISFEPIDGVAVRPPARARKAAAIAETVAGTTAKPPRLRKGTG